MKASTRKIIAGKKGELEVFNILEKIDNKVLIPDLSYEFESAFQHSSHQIDHVLITLKNIYLIEVKSYKKVLEFGYDDENWAIEYHKTGVKERKRNGIDNPVLQNRNHRISFLQKINRIPINHILAISVVLSETDITHGKKWRMITETDFLVKPEYLQEFIEKYEDESQEIIDLETIVREIYCLQNISQYNHIKYCEQIKKVKKYLKTRKDLDFNQLQFQKKTCNCGSKMYIRCGNNLNSVFWGCSSYPKCNNIEKI